MPGDAPSHGRYLAPRSWRGRYSTRFGVSLIDVELPDRRRDLIRCHEQTRVCLKRVHITTEIDKEKLVIQCPPDTNLILERIPPSLLKGVDPRGYIRLPIIQLATQKLAHACVLSSKGFAVLIHQRRSLPRVEFFPWLEHALVSR